VGIKKEHCGGPLTGTALNGGGGRSLGSLEKITNPVTSSQVICFTIGTGGTAQMKVGVMAVSQS